MKSKSKDIKNILVVFISIMFVSRIEAQRFRAGLSSGVDASRMTINEAGGLPLTYKTKLSGGLFTEIALSKLLSIQVEANYSPQGNAAIDGQNSRSLNFNYLTLPILVGLSGTENLKFLLGGQLGILLNAKAKLNNDPTGDFKTYLRSKDYYGVFGVEYGFDNGVFAGGRYQLGLTNIALDPLPAFHNRYFSFRIGYRFSRKNR